MEHSDLFKPITDHILACKDMDCSQCAKVFGDKKPIALVLAKLYELPSLRDDSTPKERE